MRYVLLALLACACGGGPYERAEPPASRAALEDAREILLARCHAHDEDPRACERDWACMSGPPEGGCDHGVCTQGGPSRCLPCIDVARLRGGMPASVCSLRAAGLDREACELLQREHPERCAALE